MMFGRPHYLSGPLFPFSSKQRKLKPGSLTSRGEHKIQIYVKGLEKVYNYMVSQLLEHRNNIIRLQDGPEVKILDTRSPEEP